MRYRPLGTTGIKVSEIGFGTWGIGGATADEANSYGETNDAESVRTLRRALELGINCYDTSNIYGYGHSEELLRKAFANDRDKVIIADKVGFVKHGGPHNIDPAYIRKCLEESLQRLGTDYVDIYQLHSVPMEMLQATPEAVDTLRALKAEGKIRAFGYSVKTPAEAITVIKEYGFECVEVNFNMIDQRALDSGLFEAAAQNGAGIIARTPFGFGFLTGAVIDIHFDPKDHRSTWPEAQLKRWVEAPKLFSPINRNPKRSQAQFALQFCVAFDAVSTVIPGMLHPAEVDEDAEASQFPPLTKDELDAIRQVYANNEFFDKSLKKV
jgi:aryl-alcohol dehydrogenase-like predicted oxidoreductase